jgi:hypothetical protein
MKHDEYDIQKQIVQYVEAAHPGVMFCASLGGLRLPMGLAVKAKKLGYRKGFPDLEFPEPRGCFHGLYIELKADEGKPRADQLRVVEKLNLRGYRAVFCYGFEEARKEIDSYLSL